FIESFVAAPAVPVAVNVVDAPRMPAVGFAGIVARRVFAPAVVPSVHDVIVAFPDASVSTVEPLTGLMLPPPPMTSKRTPTLASGLLFESVTFTTGAVATAEPAMAD